VQRRACFDNNCNLHTLDSEGDSLLDKYVKKMETTISVKMQEKLTGRSHEHETYKNTNLRNGEVSPRNLTQEIVDPDTLLGSEVDSLLTEGTKKSETDVQSVSIKKRITRELVMAFYTAQLFLPGFFSRQFFLIVALVTPFLDFGTDYYNAGLIKRYTANIF